MALICDVELESGLNLNDVYLRVTSFSGSENHVNFNLSVYVSVENYENERSPVTQINHNMEFDKDRNLFRQMYEHLRAFPEYKDAVEA